ncbi:hypothetical protein D3C85_1282710 [compost metagenome]
MQPARQQVAPQTELHEVVAAGAGNVDQVAAVAVRRAQQRAVDAKVERPALRAADLARDVAREKEGQQQLVAGRQLHVQVVVQPEIEVQRARAFPGRGAQPQDAAAVVGPAHLAAGAVVQGRQRERAVGGQADQRGVEIVLAQRGGRERRRLDRHSLRWDRHRKP